MFSFILESPTGSDGVDGASFASKGMDEETKAKPPAGDPLLGKDLMDATLVLIEKNLIAGLQDMGCSRTHVFLIRNGIQIW